MEDLCDRGNECEPVAVHETGAGRPSRDSSRWCVLENDLENDTEGY